MRVPVRPWTALSAIALATFMLAGTSGGAQQSPADQGQGPERFKEGEQPLATEPAPTRFIYPTRNGVFVPLPKVPPVYDTFAYKIRVVTVGQRPVAAVLAGVLA